MGAPFTVNDSVYTALYEKLMCSWCVTQGKEGKEDRNLLVKVGERQRDLLRVKECDGSDLALLMSIMYPCLQIIEDDLAIYVDGKIPMPVIKTLVNSIISAFAVGLSRCEEESDLNKDSVEVLLEEEDEEGAYAGTELATP